MTQVSAKIQLIGGRRAPQAPAQPAAAPAPSNPQPLADRYTDTFVRGGAAADYAQLRLLQPWNRTAAPAASAAPQPTSNAAPQLPQRGPAGDLPEATPRPVGLQYKAQAAAPVAAPAPARISPISVRAEVITPAAPAAPAAPAVPTPVVVNVSAPAAPAAPVAPTVPAPAVPAAFAQVAEAIRNAGSDQAAYEAAMKLLVESLEQRHAQPAQDKPDDKADDNAAERLKDLEPKELARLGAEDKQGFFAALRPAAEAAEKQYGVPAAVTLAQAALETGWGKHIIPGFNIFGIKGKGPAGTTAQGTWEVYDGKTVTITANFAKYHNFFEAVFAHGKLFHNGYYDKAMEQFQRDHDPFAFARNITGTYATDPQYGAKLSSIMRQYRLV